MICLFQQILNRTIYYEWKRKFHTFFGKYFNWSHCTLNSNCRHADRLTSVVVLKAVAEIAEFNDNSKNPILHTYKVFKLSHHMENYISCKLDNRYKKAIAQFRVSSHKLGIETGRHEKPIIPPNCRICKYCQQDSTDDEQHFLVDCHFHDEDRYTLLEVMSNYINDIDGKNSREKFILIMKCKEIPALNALGKYIHNGFQKGKSC